MVQAPSLCKRPCVRKRARPEYVPKTKHVVSVSPFYMMTECNGWSPYHDTTDTMRKPMTAARVLRSEPSKDIASKPHTQSGCKAHDRNGWRYSVPITCKADPEALECVPGAKLRVLRPTF